jgi:hypothetical protein
MARSIQEIYNEMIIEKQSFTNLLELQPSIDNAQTLLNDLNTPSRVARWRLIFYVLAFGIWVLEKTFDLHKKEIEDIAKEIPTGTLPWYKKQALIFQFGYDLVWDGNRYAYANENPTAEIVKLVSCNEVGSSIVMKVAKLSGTTAQELNVIELLAFNAYVNKIKFAGVKVLVVSRPADLLKIDFKIYYNPLILSATGQSLSDGSYPVHDAIDNYILKLPFDGVLSVTALTDRVQSALGVVNPIFQMAAAKYGATPYQNFEDYYAANAGHIKIDPLYPLTTSITYLPYV